jgi:hypothetical protein
MGPHKHRHTAHTQYTIHKHTPSLEYSLPSPPPLSLAHTHQVTLHSAVRNIQEALVDLAQSVAAATNTTVSSRLARHGRPQSLSVHPVSVPPAIATLKRSFSAVSRSAPGKQSAACISASAGSMQTLYSTGPAQLQSHIGADRAVPERAGSDWQRYPVPHPAQQPQKGLPAAGREDRRYFDDGYGGGGVSGCTQMPVRGGCPQW